MAINAYVGTLPLLLTILFASALHVFPVFLRFLGRSWGSNLKRRGETRRFMIIARVHADEEIYVKDGSRSAASGSDDDDWERLEKHSAASAKNGGQAEQDWQGIVGFFHPYCNAGGGGERVLWCAIQATQARWPKAVCVVYTGDHEADKPAILARIKDRFDITLHPPTVVFLYLTTRQYVHSSTYPHFTLLGQSLGSLVLAYDAFTLLVPDIFIDTMGYAFALALSKFFFPHTPTGAYVHYPTISTDMLDSLGQSGQGLNSGAGTGLRGSAKKMYWHWFAKLYGWVGGNIDVVMANSTWTRGHLRSLWGPSRRRRKGKYAEIETVFPPVAVAELKRQIDVSPASEKAREMLFLSIAQFRPEKNHSLLLQSFAIFLQSRAAAQKDHDPQTPKLVLVGSVRNSEDATRVYDLRLLAHELRIREHVDFVCDASWPEILELLRRSWIGVNGMWNEHFGIGVVEYQAAGLISVVHDSGGPKYDIVVPYAGGATGYHASTAEGFAAVYEEALSLTEEETLAMRLRARESATRFTESAFAEHWVVHMERLIALSP
ncbi:MAG: hypothetical protein M1825_000746 [Sarcosagium campestre]|nr:MAG: hypothetical protein M1825_000746 [Sarcosagium campestre]